MPLPEFSLRIANPPGSLEIARVIEEYEGPILSEYRTTDGRGIRYIEKWCTRAGDTDRWLLVRTEQRAVAEYLGRRISMLSLIQGPSDGIGFIVDRRGDVVVAVFLVHLAELPPVYLPRESAYHDESLRPEWPTTPQSFLFGSGWDARAIAGIERRYHDVTAFSHFTEVGSNRSLPAGILGYRMDRGFPIAGAFNRIRALIPRSSRAQSAGLSAASPGVFTLEAPTQMATRLLHTLASLDGARDAYEALYSWSKIPPKALDRMPDAGDAVRDLQSLCDKLAVDRTAILPPPAQSDPEAVLTAGKMIAAYYRRLWELVSTDGIEFLGVVVDRTTSPVGEPTDGEDEDEFF